MSRKPQRPRVDEKKKPMDLDFVLRFYDAYSRSPNIEKVAHALNFTGPNLAKRIEKHKELQDARDLADSLRGKQTLSGYVFEHLSKEAQEIWKKLQQCNSLEASQRIFSRKTKEIRQELFIYALVNSSYDISKACRMIGMDRVQVNKWKHDLEFLQLMEEIQWQKKNFFESSLVQLVEERHPGAVIFVNRTLNADRGYSEKVQVEHSGTLDHSFSIDQLHLDTDTKRKLLQSIRSQKAPQLTNGNSNPLSSAPVIDVEETYDDPEEEEAVA